jgi:hypothetical protein
MPWVFRKIEIMETRKPKPKKMTCNWLRKNKGLDKYYNPWNGDILEILYEVLDKRLDNVPDSFFLDPENYNDDYDEDPENYNDDYDEDLGNESIQNEDTIETKVYYRRKQYARESYEDLEACLIDAELIKIKTMEKIRFVGGDMSRLSYTYNEREFTEKKVKSLEKLRETNDNEFRQQFEKNEKEIRDIINQHKLLLKNRKNEHRENKRMLLQHHAIQRRNFEKEWANKYIKIMK